MNTLIETFKNKNRPNFLFLWCGWLIYDLIMIAEGLVRLCTLNFYMPNWTMDFIFWHTKFGLRLKNKGGNEK